MSQTRVVPSSKTLLAYGITEWTGAIEHLEAMATVVFVPRQTVEHLIAERRILLWKWQTYHFRQEALRPAIIEQIIAEALAHLTAHPYEIDLIEKKLEEQP